MGNISGGEWVVRVLEREDVNKVFCVPGESYLGVLDSLYDHSQIQLISNRHEGGASFMAEAYAKASGEVGVCMATRGVGASNLSIGLHTAFQDSTPVVALIGQVERPYMEKEAFQEIDLASYFRHTCKWTVEIRDVNRIPELLHRAFHVARSGRPGPVVVSLPHDMLEDLADDSSQEYGSRINKIGPQYPGEACINQAAEIIAKAKKPVVIAGGGISRSQSTPLLQKFAEQWQLPVVTVFRRYDVFPNDHPCYAGWLGFGPNPDLLEYIRETDLVIALGTRFSQVTTQDYKLLKPGVPLIHVDVSPETFGKVYTPTLPIAADVQAFLEKMMDKKTEARPKRENLLNALHQSFLAFSTPSPHYSDSEVDLEGLMHDLVCFLPEDAIITSDAGNFFGWLARYYHFKKPGTYIGPTSGAMGYGLPAAIGAKLAHPEQQVISFSGDGGFMMTLQELETAVRYKVPTVSIVVNNNLYGTIRAHQEKHFPDRVVGTELSNPSFAELALLFGGHGKRVERNRDFIPALKEAIQSGKPAVVEVMTNPDILTVNQKKPEPR
ncbi:MAG TPA: thiamine pyrophosphate-dependent enzyme [Bacillales bacterium]|nr:thiamine pyrophosphate-dependent enzyme [Bacillales bacterium]